MAANITVDVGKCTGCGVCISVCPLSVYVMDSGKSRSVKEKECTVCRACENMCPEEAIAVEEVFT